MTSDQLEGESPRPDGAISGLLYEHSRRLAAARRHGQAEGIDTDGRAVLDSYSRTERPISHRVRERARAAGKPATIVAAGAAFWLVESLAFAVVALTGDAAAWPIVAWFAGLALLSIGAALWLDGGGSHA